MQQKNVAFMIKNWYNCREDGEDYMLFTYPDKTEEKITHDMVKCATVLAMGVVGIQKNSKQTTKLYGTKYLCVFNDGR